MTETEFSSSNWAHQALLLMDEADWLIRWGAVSAESEKYKLASKAFWDVIAMLSTERDRLNGEKTDPMAARNKPAQRLEALDCLAAHQMDLQFFGSDETPDRQWRAFQNLSCEAKTAGDLFEGYGATPKEAIAACLVAITSAACCVDNDQANKP